MRTYYYPDIRTDHSKNKRHTLKEESEGKRRALGIRGAYKTKYRGKKIILRRGASYECRNVRKNIKRNLCVSNHTD